MIDSLVKDLFGSLVKVGLDKWKDSAQFRMLRLVAHEKTYRELRWNLECLASSKSKDRLIYLSALRRDAFGELEAIGAPIDDIFTVRMKAFTATGGQQSNRLLKILDEDDLLSKLLDRTYNRIGILQLRIDKALPLGDVSYVRSLIKLSLQGVEYSRNELR